MSIDEWFQSHKTEIAKWFCILGVIGTFGFAIYEIIILFN